MKSILSILVLVLGVMGVVSIASSDIIARTDWLFFSEPIPCHVYLKRKEAFEKDTSYVPGSFFQVKVELLGMEPDVTRIQQIKDFLQAQLESYEEQDPNRVLYAEKVEKALESIEGENQALVLRVLETLEGQSPGKEIVISVGPRGIGGQALIEGKAKVYMLGFQGFDKRIHGITVDTNDLYERDNWFLTEIKKWIGRMLSECDNV